MKIKATHNKKPVVIIQMIESSLDFGNSYLSCIFVDENMKIDQAGFDEFLISDKEIQKMLK